MHFRRFFIELPFILLLGLVIAFFLIETNLDGKLFKVTVLALLGLTVLQIIPYREKTLLCLAAFLLPLSINVNLIREKVEFSRPINGFIVSAFDIPFFLLLMLWLYRLTNNYNIRVKIFPHITFPFFLIWIFALVGLYLTSVSLPIRIAVLWTVLKGWLILIYLANNINQKKTIYLLIVILLLSGLLQGGLGIAQYINKGPIGLGIIGESDKELQLSQTGAVRVGGTIGHANKFALYLEVLLQLNLTLFFVRFSHDFIWLQWLRFVPFTAMLIALLLTSSRGGWAAFLVGGVINSYWCMALRTGKKIFSAVFVLTFFTVFATIIFMSVPSVRNRILMDDGGSAEIRKPTEKIARNMIRDNPLVGIGLNNYQSAIRKYDDTAMGASYHFPASVHNEFLLIAAELGLPAFFLFLLIIAQVSLWLIQISRSKSDSALPYLASGFLCGLISWSIHTQKDYQNVFFTTRFWFYMGIMLAMKSIIDLERSEEKIV